MIHQATEIKILEALAEHPTLTAPELRSVSGSPGALHWLRFWGYIERHRDARDARVFLYAITPRGRARLEKLKEAQRLRAELERCKAIMERGGER